MRWLEPRPVILSAAKDLIADDGWRQLGARSFRRLDSFRMTSLVDPFNGVADVDGATLSRALSGGVEDVGGGAERQARGRASGGGGEVDLGPLFEAELGAVGGVGGAGRAIEV